MTSPTDAPPGVLHTSSVPRPATNGGGGSGWHVVAGPIALVAIPSIASVLRVVEAFGGPQLLPENPRITASPAPLVVHVISAVFFAVVGALQFPTRLHRRHPGWHRRSGRVLIGAGMVVAVTGLWMTLFYTDAPGGAALWTVRLVVGAATGTSLILGFAAIRRGDVRSHRAWMIRAYALMVGAGTQTMTEGVSQFVLGFTDLGKFLGTTAGWVVNVAIAEWLVRRTAKPAGTPARTP